MVEEVLPFTPDGEGEHALLYVEKRGLNTADVTRMLARIAGVAERDIGFCGLKDKHAQTSQWFSVGLAGKPEPDWLSLDQPQVRIIVAQRHRKKLRRGVHRSNRFALRLRDLGGDRESLEGRLQAVSRDGVPNYFGPQRFGINGENLNRAQAWFAGTGPSPRRQKRSFYLSAARSFLFNELLAQRVSADSWQEPLAGDLCMLAGSGSFFT